MKKVNFRFFIRFSLTVLLILGSTVPVFANGNALPGSTRLSDTSYQVWDVNDTFSISANIDNSYHCRTIGASLVDILEFKSNFLLSPGDVAPTVTYNGDDQSTNAEQAFSFIALSKGEHTIGFSRSLGQGTGGKARAFISCHDTTLYGNFNTIAAANPINYLELKNISSKAIVASIIVKKFEGTELSRFQVSLNPGTRQDIAVHDVSGAANTFGSIVVAHTGSVGSLVGNVSKYTFNGSSLSITATEAMLTRVQK